MYQPVLQTPPQDMWVCVDCDPTSSGWLVGK
uniref:Uncharacterized protein n=1 Tax=Arundo donax TaxID=35708 RepID=A0A0A9A3L4_ARUDO